MDFVALCAGIVLIIAALWDAFETVILPRRVTRMFRITRIVYFATWGPWQTLARRLRAGQREGLLSYYGPLSLLFLLGIWGIALIVGF
ncbi:MAG TPA: two pore domain potassium channel family protein, partial [Chloroflexota bacterium]|nr:two pore domain potassium channel family protein [Chloroflexota bacterium]